MLLHCEMPMVGEFADVDPKDDHVACFPVFQAWLGDQMRAANERMGREAGVVIGADYHGAGMWTPGFHEVIPWGGIVGCGTSNDPGNIRLADEHNYVATAYAESQMEPGQQISLYWRLFAISQELTRTIRLRCWDGIENDYAPGLDLSYEFTPAAYEPRILKREAGVWVDAVVEKREGGVWVPA
jgi:hypothetical protein